MATPQDTTAKADELAAPLDLLLTSATKPFASRMMPNATWARFAGNLAQHPGAVADRAGTLTRELGSIARGQVAPRSGHAPTNASATLRGRRIRCCTESCRPTWRAPRPLRSCSPMPQLDWRDNEKMRFVMDNVVKAWRRAITR